MILQQLNKKINRELFDCGEEELNIFFKQYSSQGVKNRDFTCFVLTSKDGVQPIGFFTLSSASLEDEIMGDIRGFRSGYKVIPVTLLGRLAVDKKFQGKGIGKELLLQALKIAESSVIGNHGVLVKAKNQSVAEFYRNLGFIDLPSNGQEIFLFFLFARKKLN